MIGNKHGGERSGKAGEENLQVKLNENEPMKKPRKGKLMRNAGGYVCNEIPAADQLVVAKNSLKDEGANSKWGDGGMRSVQNYLNSSLLKWVKWEKGLYKYTGLAWLRRKYTENPTLFAHWKLVQP